MTDESSLDHKQRLAVRWGTLLGNLQEEVNTAQGEGRKMPAEQVRFEFRKRAEERALPYRWLDSWRPARLPPLLVEATAGDVRFGIYYMGDATDRVGVLSEEQPRSE